MTAFASEVPEQLETIERNWRPAPQLAQDTVTAAGSAAFAALLDQRNPVQDSGDPLPPLWHWFMFAPTHRQSELGEDGHPRDGAFTPPIPHRRRVFGGGRLQVTAPLRCGDRVQRESRASSVRTRIGSTGPLLLVTVRSEFSVEGNVRMVEEQDLVYRSVPPGTPRPQPAAAASAPPQPSQAAWTLSLTPDPRLLFRFSALTSNAHRIHYDHPYTTKVEGHPGLVVHGPLLALLLLELPRRHDSSRQLAELHWRVHRTIYEGTQVIVAGTPDGSGAHLTAGTATAADCATATLAFAER